MSKSTRADSVLFGFDFQVNAAIVLLLENITDLKALRLEGNYEDIEIELTNNSYILAQAKSVVNASSDFNNVTKNLKKSLTTLSEKRNNVRIDKYIYITNSPNPLNDNKSKSIFYGHAHRDYNSLPDTAQKAIDRAIEKTKISIDLNKFMIQVLPFETDNDKERYKVVCSCIEEFVGELDLNSPGLTKKLMTTWHNEIFKNGTKKDASIKLTKEDLIWPIMVIVTKTDKVPDWLNEEIDESLYEEIAHKYKNLIENYCEKCEFFTKVLSDYNLFQCKNFQKKQALFVEEKWSDYSQEFYSPNIDPELQKMIAKITLSSIIKNRISIDKIKKGVNL